jgi:hypothetical protein
MITSERINTDLPGYYERIYQDGERIAYLGNHAGEDKDFFVVNKDQFLYKDYPTVADAKEALFRIYPEFN